MILLGRSMISVPPSLFRRGFSHANKEVRMKPPTRLRAPFHGALPILWFSLALLALSIQPAAQGRAAHAAPAPQSAVAAIEGIVKEAHFADDYIVYWADYAIKDRFDLYSAPVAGGVATRLTASLPAGTIESFKVAGGYVVFGFRSDANNRRYLYSIPAAGGALTLLGPTYPANPPHWVGSQLVFGIAGERVVFAVDAQVPNGFELYSAPLAGGPAVRLSPELPPVAVQYPAPFWVTSFAIDDGAGRHVALNVNKGPVAQGSGLYAAPADGSTPPTRISDAIETQLHDTFDLTPDGQYVVYIRGTELHTVRFAGGGDALIDTGTISGWKFAITPDSARIVYAPNTWPSTIKSAPIGGGTPVFVADSASAAFQLTPDGARVFYGDADLTGLFFAPVLGGAAQPVFNTPLGGVNFSADGAYAVFVAGEDAARGLYSYAIPDGPAVRIDDPAASLGGMLLFEGVLAAERALYTASNTAAPDTYRLYSVPFAGGAATPLTGDLGYEQELIWVREALGNQVLFTSGTRMNGPTRWHRLYVVPADGSAPPRLVDTPRRPGADGLFLPLLSR
jgi:hypothetical protein